MAGLWALSQTASDVSASLKALFLNNIDMTFSFLRQRAVEPVMEVFDPAYFRLRLGTFKLAWGSMPFEEQLIHTPPAMTDEVRIAIFAMTALLLLTFLAAAGCFGRGPAIINNNQVNANQGQPPNNGPHQQDHIIGINDDADIRLVNAPPDALPADDLPQAIEQPPVRPPVDDQQPIDPPASDELAINEPAPNAPADRQTKLTAGVDDDNDDVVELGSPTIPHQTRLTAAAETRLNNADAKELILLMRRVLVSSSASGHEPITTSSSRTIGSDTPDHTRAIYDVAARIKSEVKAEVRAELQTHTTRKFCELRSELKGRLDVQTAATTNLSKSVTDLTSEVQDLRKFQRFQAHWNSEGTNINARVNQRLATLESSSNWSVARIEQLQLQSAARNTAYTFDHRLLGSSGLKPSAAIPILSTADNAFLTALKQRVTLLEATNGVGVAGNDSIEALKQRMTAMEMKRGVNIPSLRKIVAPWVKSLEGGVRDLQETVGTVSPLLYELKDVVEGGPSGLTSNGGLALMSRLSTCESSIDRLDDVVEGDSEGLTSRGQLSLVLKTSDADGRINRQEGKLLTLHNEVFGGGEGITQDGRLAVRSCVQMLMYQLGGVSDQVHGSNSDGDMQDGANSIMKQLGILTKNVIAQGKVPLATTDGQHSPANPTSSGNDSKILIKRNDDSQSTGPPSISMQDMLNMLDSQLQPIGGIKGLLQKMDVLLRFKKNIAMDVDDITELLTGLPDNEDGEMSLSVAAEMSDMDTRSFLKRLQDLEARKHKQVARELEWRPAGSEALPATQQVCETSDSICKTLAFAAIST